MLLQQLYDYYGSWARLCRDLGFGSTTYQKWLKKGYIPYSTQEIIEKRSERMFLADKTHGKKE